MELVSTHWTRLQLCYKFLCGIFRKDTQPFDFIKCNIIWKLVYKYKFQYIDQIKEVWSCFLQIWEKDFYKLIGSIVLIKCLRSIDNSNDFHLFILLWKGS